MWLVLRRARPHATQWHRQHARPLQHTTNHPAGAMQDELNESIWGGIGGKRGSFYGDLCAASQRKTPAAAAGFHLSHAFRHPVVLYPGRAAAQSVPLGVAVDEEPRRAEPARHRGPHVHDQRRPQARAVGPRGPERAAACALHALSGPQHAVHGVGRERLRQDRRRVQPRKRDRPIHPPTFFLCAQTHAGLACTCRCKSGLRMPRRSVASRRCCTRTTRLWAGACCTT